MFVNPERDHLAAVNRCPAKRKGKKKKVLEIRNRETGLIHLLCATDYAAMDDPRHTVPHSGRNDVYSITSMLQEYDIHSLLTPLQYLLILCRTYVVTLHHNLSSCRSLP